MINAKWYTGGALALAAVLLIAVNVLSSTLLGGARFDFTQHKLYTLSAGTRDTLKRLPEPVTLRLFLSRKLLTRLPQINAYATRVRELLTEYQRVAGDKLHLRIIDPEPFSEQEDRAVGYGLKGIPLGDGESNFYFGLVATGPTDTEAKIPYLSERRGAFLEYDITRLIHQVAWPNHRVVGVLSTENLNGNPQLARMGVPGAQVLMQQMRQLFAVHTLKKDITHVPSDVDVLMLVRPSGLSDRTLYAVDQYVMHGGHVLAFLDPLAESAGRSPAKRDPALSRLLNSWGVKFDPTQVTEDLQLARRVRYNGGQGSEVLDYPVWMQVPQQLQDNSDIVTANLGTLMFASAGDLQHVDGAGTRFTSLVRTTDHAAVVRSSLLTMMSDPATLVRNYKPTGKAYTLVARISGTVKNAFPEGPPGKTAPKGAPAKPALKTSTVPANIILVADTDMLRDRFWVARQDLFGTPVAIPTAANGSLVVNALDNLTGDNDLISVRNRGHFTRPFTRIDALRRQAELRYRAKERELLARLTQTEQRLAELQKGKVGNTKDAVILTADQRQELTRFRAEELNIREQLREVRHQLRKDIEGLEANIKLINIVLVPLLIAVIGVVLGVRRNRRRERVVTAGKA